MQRGKLLAIERPFTHMFSQEFYKTSVSGFEIKIRSKRPCGESRSGHSISSYSKDGYTPHRPYGGQEILSESMHSRKCEEKMLQEIKYDQRKLASQDDEASSFCKLCKGGLGATCAQHLSSAKCSE